MLNRRRRSLVLAAVLFIDLWVGLLALVSMETGLRLASVSGEKVADYAGMTVDSSNSKDGYICVKSRGKRKRLKLRLSKDGQQYTYDLRTDGEYEVFPLQLGSGSYSVSLYENVSGSSYRQVSSFTLKAALEREDIAYLYPSQYVWYDADSPAVAKAYEICEGLTSDKDRTEAVWNYVIGHYVYDFIKSLTVQKGYLPDLNEIMNTNMGICFDFASLIACMLRSQNVPTQLVIGYADNAYHAWNNILLDGEWVRYDATAVVTGSRFTEYTEERRY